MKNFIPYGRQNINEEDKKAVLSVLDSDFLTQGPKVSEFEERLCEYTGAKYCVAVANGTAALHLAVLSLDLQDGSEGMTTPNTFSASANCMRYNNMDVRFADIDNKTYNISIEGIKKNFTDNTRLIIPVHFAGQPCDMAGIHEIASERGIKIIEDASHAIGGRYSNNKRIGSCCYSDLTTFSFHPVKTMTTGEGGAITTNNPELYHRLILLRSHGITKVPEELSNNTGPWYYEMKMLGFNYRLTDIQAALGISQLNRLDDFVEHRRQLVKKYNDAFEEIPWLTVPFERPEVYSAFHLYVIGIDYRKIGKSRSEVMKLLSDDNIGTQVHYIPVYRLPYYEDLYHFDPEAFANTEKYYASCLSIPLYPSMSEKQQQYVIKKIIALNS